MADTLMERLREYRAYRSEEARLITEAATRIEALEAAAKARPMTLMDAVRVLVEAHTRDDDVTGYQVEMRPMLCGQGSYIEAFGVLRAQLHMQTEPRT